MTATRTVELTGHIIDSGMMQRVFGIVMDMGGSFEVKEFAIGRRKEERSYAKLTVQAPSEGQLRDILAELNQNGATITDTVDATTEPAPAQQVVPSGFYSTTNHPTEIRLGGQWIDVQGTEMDVAIVVDPTESRAVTKPLNAIKEGDNVVIGEAGIRVSPPERPRDTSGPFGFMQGGISSERPSLALIQQVAAAIRETKADGGEVLAVCGPALIHAGARRDLAALIRDGYIDAISAGNGFAVHDLERDLYGTSLGVNVDTLEHPRKGHKHHIYTISEIIRAGGIKAAVEKDLITGGIMFECVKNDVPYVLAGSIRDDGPLPDTISDAIEAQKAIRTQAQSADLVIMLSTLLHSVAVGNCLPSTTRVICVDINQATVTQLVDRGSAQALGIVTDVGTFVPLLAQYLQE